MILVKVVSKDMVVRKVNDEYDMILEEPNLVSSCLK